MAIGILVLAAALGGCRQRHQAVPPQSDATAPSSVVESRTDRPEPGRGWTVPGIGIPFVWLPALRCWVAKFETTNDEYIRYDPQHDSREYETHSLNAGRQPVVFVSSIDAAGFGKWLTRREKEEGRLPDGFAYRLPSGDEWTAFAQCGDQREFPWGSQWPPKCGNYADHTARPLLGVYIEDYRDRFDVSCPVEKSGSNTWGLCGVGGNVWEWTDESRGPLRLARGGAWDDYLEDFLRCSFRDELEASNRTFNVGFRLVLGPIARSVDN